MFLRFGFAVGQVGLLGTIAIILIGHAVTIPTAMAIAEIATNQKVEGGGEYYIVSRSFGLVIGATIGIALYLSQAISVAFYIMAFAEAFGPLMDWLRMTVAMPDWLDWLLSKRQTVGIPALVGLTGIMLTRGADLGVKTLYVVVATLAISLVAFFAGVTEYEKTTELDLLRTVSQLEQIEGADAGAAIGDSRGPGVGTEGADAGASTGDRRGPGAGTEGPEAPAGDREGSEGGSGHTRESVRDGAETVGDMSPARRADNPGDATRGTGSEAGGLAPGTSDRHGSTAAGAPVREQIEPADETAVSGDSRNDIPVGPIAVVGFFTVFAIIFPGFTGMTAGVGLSGNLADPGKSIPLGTLAATIVGMIVYVFIAWKLASAAPPEHLADTSRLVMADIAWQGWWLIPVGLAAATISSALGSIMVAPRTLQAIARDRIFPSITLNRWLSLGKGSGDEPYNASVITVAIGLFFILLGGLDMVAIVISMFFMVTYGSLCLISFLQHFAADPSYRPRFKSRWYISLFGALACFALMFFMNPGYAVLAIILMVGLYFYISQVNRDKQAVALIFQGAIFQLSRRIQVFLLKANKEKSGSWRPSAICLSESSFERLGAFDLLRWISQRYGFGTYIHLIKGYLSRQTGAAARESKERLIRMIEASESNMYVDTLVSPSYTSSVAQVIQLPGMAGADNNLILFEFSKDSKDNLVDIIDNFKLIKAVDFDILLLGSSHRGFGMKKDIHVWITSGDYQNANLMILLAYIISGHRDWKKSEIKIFAIAPEKEVSEERNRLATLIQTGQLPISPKNIRIRTLQPELDKKSIIKDTSRDADLTIIGFREEAVKKHQEQLFLGFEELGNVLFVHAAAEKNIK